MIFFVLTLVSGCTATRRQGRGISSPGNSSSILGLHENIINQNITANSFFIERAEFRIISGAAENSGLATMKFLMPDKFLITIKSRTGIEIARVFLSGDSIMANDRFNKKLLYGSASYLKGKYGLTTALLPLVLGDYVNDKQIDNNKIICTDGNLKIDGIVKDVRIQYLVDCILGKSIKAIPEDISNENVLEFRYSNFLYINNIYIPGKIEITENKSNTKIEIKIQKFISPWEGKIEFIPGKQYEKIYLQ